MHHLLLTVLLSSVPASEVDPTDDWVFTPQRAEHLLNRAAFGVTTHEAERRAAEGLEPTLDWLFASRGEPGPPFYLESFGVTYEILRQRLGVAKKTREGHERTLRALRQSERALDKEQLTDYARWWLERMVAHEDPLRDRMTLFWHGHFTSSQEDVRNGYELCQQHQLLRREALGSFREMLHGIARDPAMLEYLDNGKSTRRKPNENFARELLELFTLGEGNYTEADVLAAARAFSGWTDENGVFVIDEKRVDPTEKTFLGHTGNLGGADVLDILLADPRCAEHVAGSIVAWLEGVEPSSERRATYGRLLYEADYELAPMLRELFADPAFYREGVVARRIAGPVDLIVGQVRRLEVDPPARLIEFGVRLLGQKLFFPPSVKGWDEGRAWITTASLMQRGNLAGVFTGQLDADVLRDTDVADPEALMEEATEPMMEMLEDSIGERYEEEELATLTSFGWRPRLDFSRRLARRGAESARDVVRTMATDLLAVQPEQATIEELGRWWQTESAGLETPVAREHALRRLAHMILALPEGQLH